MFKILITVLAFGVMAATPLLRAQDAPKGGKGGRGQMSVEDRVAAIDQAVGGLKAEQTAKIKAIIEKTRADMQAMPQEERKSKGRDLQTAEHDQIRALLTPEQQTKFDAMPQPGRGGKKKKDQ
jgi:Spy/CpxP family protein refolding chaperone